MKYSVTASMRAIDALRKLYPDSSHRTLKNWLTAGRFFLDGTPLTRGNTPLLPGQTLSAQTTFRASPFPILHEDRFLIAIDKPSGLLSTPLDEGKPSRHALGILREHLRTDQIFPVHRIDRDTSGVLLFARGHAAEQRLKALFEAHDLTREYLAIVEGRLHPRRGTWTSRLLELPSYSVIESPDGREATTHFEVLRYSPKYSYLKLTLETGRKHQIRVHCSAAGHPILGDLRYGALENPIRRPCLHAALLELIHPFTQKRLSFASPLPPSFKPLGSFYTQTK